jgi:putative oxidoreductase
VNTALLILRVVFGVAMTAYGCQKLFGWFGGPGIKGFGSFLQSIGFRPGVRFALAAGGMELVGGLLVTLGLGGPIGPTLMISVLVVGAVTVHLGHGFFVSTNGVELPVLYLAGAMALTFAGPGQYSLDYAFGLDSAFSQTASLIALALGVLGAVGNLAMRDAPKSLAKSS